VGHRVVHGGPKYSQPQRITADMVAELRCLSPFDPEHLPEEILLTEAFHRRFPDLPKWRASIRAFHHDLPRVAMLLPIPHGVTKRRECAVRVSRVSYAFLMEELARVAGAQAAQGRVILAHLGNGASLAAVRDGHVRGHQHEFYAECRGAHEHPFGRSRSGLVWYLSRTKDERKQFNEMVNFQSGLLGYPKPVPTCVTYWTMRRRTFGRLRRSRSFCYQVKKWLGAFAAALGGLDTLVFAAASARTRLRFGADLCWAGFSRN